MHEINANQRIKFYTNLLLSMVSNQITDYMDISHCEQIIDLTKSIPCGDNRQTVYEMLTDSVDDIDLDELYDIMSTVDGGKEWFEIAVPKIIRAYYSHKIELVDIDNKYCSFIKTITSNENIMQRVSNGKVWSETQVNQFIKWCTAENNQSAQERNNYYYIITEYINDKAVPIGVVGVARKKKHKPKGVNYNLIIFIDEQYHNWGAGTSAIASCLEKYWNIYPNRSITFNIPEDRPNMIKVATKLGAVFDKTFSTNLCKYEKYVANPSTFNFNPGLHLDPMERRKLVKSRKRLIKLAAT